MYTVCIIQGPQMPLKTVVSIPLDSQTGKMALLYMKWY